MKTPAAPGARTFHGRILAQPFALPRQSTFCPPASQPKTYNDCTASADPISDRIVPRFSALYRETEIFCKSKTATFNSTPLYRAFPSRACGIATPAILLFPRKYLISLSFFVAISEIRNQKSETTNMSTFLSQPLQFTLFTPKKFPPAFTSLLRAFPPFCASPSEC